MATALANPSPHWPDTVARVAETGVERLARFEAWQRNLTDTRRDEMAALIVLRMDADMRLRVIRAACVDLSGYALGHDTIIEGVDLVQADLDVEDARQMGGVR